MPSDFETIMCAVFFKHRATDVQALFKQEVFHMFRHVRTLVNVFALNGELTLVRRLLRKLQDLLKALYRARFLAWDICRTYRIGPAPKFFCLVHDSLLLSMSPLGQSYSVETISCPPIFPQAYARLVLP